MDPERLWQHLKTQLEAAKLTSEKRLLVAWSGGLDSSVLVDLLERHRHRGGPAVELIHVEHGLRSDSARDARFCRAQADQKGLPIQVERLDFGDREVSQAEARRRRLAAIADCALSRGIADVAFGHHGDDRIETLLFHLRRGTGLDGLSTMRHRAPFPIAGCELRIVRPLAGCTRAELEEYAHRQEVAHITDPTNATDAYSRNRLRHQVVPRVAEDRQQRRAMIDSIANLDAERRAAEHATDALERQARRPWPGLQSRAFDRQTLAAAPEATVARLFHRLEPTLDAAALRRLYAAVGAPTSPHIRHLTLSRCVITVAADRVVYHRSRARGGRDVLQRRVQPVRVEPFAGGEAPFFHSHLQWQLHCDRSEVPDPDAHHRWEAVFDPAKCWLPLRFTGFFAGARLARRDGQGKTYHQKLTKLFSSHGVDADLRWRWPCLVDGRDRLMWAAGLERGQFAQTGPSTQSAWHCRVRPSGELTEIFQP